VRRVVRNVARQLGNTPAVALGSYIDPRVIEHFEDGRTVGDDLPDARIDAVAEDMLGDDGDADDSDDEAVAVEGVPEQLVGEVHAAVADLLDAAPRRTARRRRRGGARDGRSGRGRT
jgi:hypothetical protein